MDALWYNWDMSNQKDINKVIKKLEAVCRASLEYDEWQRTCKYKHAIVCPVCEDNYYDNNSKCESHHHPKTLYTIVENIIDDHLEKNDLDDQTGFQIVQEIMDLHLLKKVQYINLCQHCHKKFHAGHPDVLNKVDTIFTNWAAKGKAVYDKAVEDHAGLDAEIVIQVQEPAKIEEVKVDFKLTAPEIEKPFKKLNAVPPLDGTSSLIQNKTSGVEPQILNIETSQDFVSIDINDL